MRNTLSLCAAVAAVAAVAAAAGGCGGSPVPQVASASPALDVHGPPSAFDDDVAFLRRHSDVIVLSDRGSRLAVSPTYQARVMTSTIGGDDKSFGWIHRAFIEKRQTGTAFDNFGGEDRFWLGPEGGPYGLYFPPGASYAFEAWQVPHPLQEGAWQLASPPSATSATFTHAMTVTNHIGSILSLDVKRTVAIVRSPPLESAPDVRYVAFSTTNRVTNTGSSAWSEASGMPSIWILGMFAPAADARVVIPFRAPTIKDDYFGKVPADRLAVRDRYLVFRCDGQHRSKIGVGPRGALQVAASYSPKNALLTVVTYDPPPVPDGRYVNSAWEEQKAPFAGDVINSYNDGPVAPGKPSLGGFYEIETSSPALALAPGASFTHVQTTMHVTGSRTALDAVARKLVGVSLDEIESPNR